MTINDAISRLDGLCYNTYTRQEKMEWLSRVESMVQTLIHNANRGKRGGSILFDPDRDGETDLLVQAPFDDLYLRWMEAQIHYANGENDKYNNAMEMFQTAFDAYSNYYTRTRMPATRKIRFF